MDKHISKFIIACIIGITLCGICQWGICNMANYLSQPNEKEKTEVLIKKHLEKNEYYLARAELNSYNKNQQKTEANEDFFLKTKQKISKKEFFFLSNISSTFDSLDIIMNSLETNMLLGKVHDFKYLQERLKNFYQFGKKHQGSVCSEIISKAERLKIRTNGLLQSLNMNELQQVIFSKKGIFEVKDNDLFIYQDFKNSKDKVQLYHESLKEIIFQNLGFEKVVYINNSMNEEKKVIMNTRIDSIYNENNFSRKNGINFINPNCFELKAKIDRT